MASRSTFGEELRIEAKRQKGKKKTLKLKKSGWKPGALVRVKENIGWDNFIGTDAIVLEHIPEEEQVLLQFDQEFPQLHDGDGKGRPNRCLYVGDVQIYSVSKVRYNPNIFTNSEGVFVNEETTSEDEESPIIKTRIDDGRDSSEAEVESMWPERLGEVPPNLGRAEYFKKRDVARYAARVVMGEDTPDDSDESRASEPEEGLFEEVEVASERPSQSTYARFDPHASINAISAGGSVGRTGESVSRKVSIRSTSRSERPPLEIGDLCKILNADGMRTPYDNISASILSKGKFGRFLLQFSHRIPNGHAGAGVGEPGRCKWFYAKDVVGISVNQAVMLDQAFSKPKKSRRPKAQVVRQSGGSWSPSAAATGHEPEQSSGSMWDEEVIPPVKKSNKGKSLPPITTSGKMSRGARVIVHAPPSDNKALKGQQGIIISNSPGSNVTVQFDKMIMGCHDANGDGEKGRCWNLHKMFLKLVDTDIIFYIKEDYKRGNANLKGMQVKILANITHPSSGSASVVEFKEEIPQGHSADGRGRKAHCLSVPASIIGKKKKEPPKRIKRPHEVKAEREAKKK